MQQVIANQYDYNSEVNSTIIRAIYISRILFIVMQITCTIIDK